MTEQKPLTQAKLDKEFAIFMVDPEGHIVSWNTGAEHILGYKEPEIIGQPFAILFTPEDVEAKRPEFVLQTAREIGRAEDERWHIRKDGSRLWTSVVVTPLLDEDGNLQGFANILRDLTEWKRTEEQLGEDDQRFTRPTAVILVVEDDAAVGEMLEVVLRNYGFVVKLALSGQEAIELYQQQHQTIALVLLDVQMPKMDGPTTLAALKKIRPNLRCCFMSGHTGKYDTDELLGMGACHVFPKPFPNLGLFTRLLWDMVG